MSRTEVAETVNQTLFFLGYDVVQDLVQKRKIVMPEFKKVGSEAAGIFGYQMFGKKGINFIINKTNLIDMQTAQMIGKYAGTPLFITLSDRYLMGISRSYGSLFMKTLIALGAKDISGY